MKKTILFIVSIATCFSMTARSVGEILSGTVIYEQVIQLDIQLEGDAAQYAYALPKERKSQKILFFSKDASLYENHHMDNPDEAMEMEEGSGMIIKMEEPEYRTFTDLNKSQVIEQKEFMSRVFLIESDPGEVNWRLTGNQKSILNYSCQEAVSDMEGKKVHAWFTPQIPVPAGPALFGNLPGLILAIEMDQGDHIIQAISVEPGPVNEEMMKKPSKGKKVTEEEYQAIVDEKMKEMGAEGGEGGGHAIVVKISH
jgi:GLPGLI family protein